MTGHAAGEQGPLHELPQRVRAHGRERLDDPLAELLEALAVVEDRAHGLGHRLDGGRGLVGQPVGEDSDRIRLLGRLGKLGEPRRGGAETAQRLLPLPAIDLLVVGERAAEAGGEGALVALGEGVEVLLVREVPDDARRRGRLAEVEVRDPGDERLVEVVAELRCVALRARLLLVLVRLRRCARALAA